MCSGRGGQRPARASPRDAGPDRRDEHHRRRAVASPRGRHAHVTDHDIPRLCRGGRDRRPRLARAPGAQQCDSLCCRLACGPGRTATRCACACRCRHHYVAAVDHLRGDRVSVHEPRRHRSDARRHARVSRMRHPGDPRARPPRAAADRDAAKSSVGRHNAGCAHACARRDRMGNHTPVWQPSPDRRRRLASSGCRDRLARVGRLVAKPIPRPGGQPHRRGGVADHGADPCGCSRHPDADRRDACG